MKSRNRSSTSRSPVSFFRTDSPDSRPPQRAPSLSTVMCTFFVPREWNDAAHLAR